MKKKTILITVTVLLCAVAAWLFTAGPLAPSNDPDAAAEAMERLNPVGPDFSADSAYAFTKAQCDFGPRDMNSAGHERCAEWIIAKFKQYGCEVTTQQADLKGYDGTTLKNTNIMARWNPAATTRIMLCAHWDSRPWADNDPDSTNWHKPILAANDAASGVAVMLEVARLLSAHTAGGAQTAGGAAPADAATLMASQSLGVDFVCFDAEDWGTPQWSEGTADDADTWALGAQHWAKNKPQNYAPRYAVLLDMVGGQGARFYQEGVSLQYAPEIVKKVWQAARQAGYGSFFPKSTGGMITDDHVPVNQVAGIPCIDIISYYPDCEQSSFGPTWHTVADDLDHIDPGTLKAVGQTIVQVLFTEE